MERSDWTPAVLITATVSLLTAGMIYLMNPWGYPSEPRAGDTIPRHALQPEVIVWIGDLRPDVKAVLGPVWGDTKPDRDHDGLLNKNLGLEGDRALAYYRLLVFNTSDETQSLRLGDGRLVMEGENGDRASLRSLSRMVEQGEVVLDPGLAFSLRGLGTLITDLEIPAGRAASLVVPFDAGSPRIETARVVGIANEESFRRRQMARAAFRRLIEDPDEARVKDL